MMLPQYLLNALPKVKTSGAVSFATRDYRKLQSSGNVFLLPVLTKIHEETREDSLLPEKGTRELKPTADYQRLDTLIAELLKKQGELRAVWPMVYCTEHSMRAAAHASGIDKIDFYACQVCHKYQYLVAATTGLVGYLGKCPFDDMQAIYLPIWDDGRRDDINLDLLFDQFHVYPGLGPSLERALVDVINTYLNNKGLLPSIHLYTDEPLTENTRRLIAPYLK